MQEREQRHENIPGLPEGSWAVIKKFSGGEQARIKSAAFEVKVDLKTGSAEQTGKIDMFKMQMNMLVYGVKEASFLKPGMTPEQRWKYYDEDIDGDAFNFLFQVINKFNAPSEALQKK